MKHPSIITTCLCVAAGATAIATIPAVALAGSPADAPPSAVMSNKLSGKTVFLDPGHQGPNHTENLERPVSDGRGGTKACQTTGMTTMHGVPEHTINWNVAQMVKQSLEALGARVLLSRQDDTGWGGCVDQRAAAANASHADVAMSIHADGAPAADHGFHLIIPKLPVADAKADQVQSTTGLAATKVMRAAYQRAGFTVANYGGAADGLMTRADIAGPALTEVPEIFLEMGNGDNPQDAGLLETPQGRLQHAVAITTGLVSYLLNIPLEATAPADAAPAPNAAAGQSNPQAPGAQAPGGAGTAAGQGNPLPQGAQAPAAGGVAGQGNSLPSAGQAPAGAPAAAGQGNSLPPAAQASAAGVGGVVGQGNPVPPGAQAPAGTPAAAGQGSSQSPAEGQSSAIAPAGAGIGTPSASAPSGSGSRPLPPSGSQGGGQMAPAGAIPADPRAPARSAPNGSPAVVPNAPDGYAQAAPNGSAAVAPSAPDGYAQAAPNGVAPGVMSPGTPGGYSGLDAQAGPGASTVPGYQAMPGAQPSPGTQGMPGAAPGTQAVPGDGLSGAQAVPPGAQGSPGTQGVPGTQPWPGTQGMPGSEGAPGTQALPGTEGMPGTQTLPGTQGSPGTQGQSGAGQAPDTAAAVGTLVTTAMHLLLPLAKSLGLGDATVNSEMLNLAYNLVATLITPWVK
ncbi:N-acetylmuramoyl-L-alanine amidase [Nocardia sp. NPDC051570]|uniref:N-acetylmuramoyl-L-alanine amidase n=1 Tax=Nocardia sp. NPDC051570 TaxID=3364324 RepID=UPI00379D0963